MGRLPELLNGNRCTLLSPVNLQALTLSPIPPASPDHLTVNPVLLAGGGRAGCRLRLRALARAVFEAQLFERAAGSWAEVGRVLSLWAPRHAPSPPVGLRTKWVRGGVVVRDGVIRHPARRRCCRGDFFGHYDAPCRADPPRTPHPPRSWAASTPGSVHTRLRAGLFGRRPRDGAARFNGLVVAAPRWWSRTASLHRAPPPAGRRRALYRSIPVSRRGRLRGRSYGL
jgi:hypothetical protein